MYLVISILVLGAGCGIWLCRFLIIAYLFTLLLMPCMIIYSTKLNYYNSQLFRIVSFILERKHQMAGSFCMISTRTMDQKQKIIFSLHEIPVD